MEPAKLKLEDYRRYGRQMILPGLGLPGQSKLLNASVVVVGAGGLGCPALQYLAASGVGRIGIVDHDIVELSNLQRQVLHLEENIGKSKVFSAAEAIKKLNSTCRVDTHVCAIEAANAISVLSTYDVILDCSDNPPTRYLLSDTAVKLGKPLVSGAAQMFDGQLCTYNLDMGPDLGRGPCYRCLFPQPPAPELAGSCEETGIFGAVTGVVGTLQAMEAVKIIVGMRDPGPSMLLYSAMELSPFRNIKLRSRKRDCPACGIQGGRISDLDYVTFCGGPRPNWEERGLAEGDNKDRRIRAKDLYHALSKPGSQSIRILDVRSRTEFGICHLGSSINIPLREILADPQAWHDSDEHAITVVVCRLGNDSQIAADALRSSRTEVKALEDGVVDLIGGLVSWSRDVDPQFPVY
ncbi:hypothetical protein BD410DRAFT_716994 [Rickenella mellea]|uniref:Rhodanese domain-containing protein n=1 Tax=Rickenella mellea TaxID=50990 RepID=A0A4Y7QCZ2_9AGAM|nr:hypothetical protein BD410DRAFT_716994 [Rickenella mellea]